MSAQRGHSRSFDTFSESFGILYLLLICCVRLRHGWVARMILLMLVIFLAERRRLSIPILQRVLSPIFFIRLMWFRINFQNGLEYF